MDMMPQNEPAERGLIGALLIDPSSYWRVTDLEPSDFYHEGWRGAFEAFQALVADNQDPDYALVEDWLRRNRAAIPDLMAAITGTPTSAHVRAYADIVLRTSGLRRMIIATAQIAQLAYADDMMPLDDKAAQAEAILQRATQRAVKTDPVHIGVAAEHILDEEQKADIVTTGINRLDTMLDGGWRQGDLVYIAGRPGMGKSTLLSTFGLNAVHRGIGTVHFTLEMSLMQTMRRYLSAESDVPVADLRRGVPAGPERDVLFGALADLKRYPLWLDDTPALSVAQMRARLRRIMSQASIGLVIVDYIQLMQADVEIHESMTNRFTRISNALKAAAKEMGCAFLVASQLSRACEQRVNKRPMLSDLRESGALEQDADIVGFLYRGAYYKDMGVGNLAELDIAKQRSGPTGTCHLFFDGSRSRFAEATLEKPLGADF